MLIALLYSLLAVATPGFSENLQSPDAVVVALKHVLTTARVDHIYLDVESFAAKDADGIAQAVGGTLVRREAVVRCSKKCVMDPKALLLAVYSRDTTPSRVELTVELTGGLRSGRTYVHVRRIIVERSSGKWKVTRDEFGGGS